jgi:hypothetical protein
VSVFRPHERAEAKQAAAAAAEAEILATRRWRETQRHQRQIYLDQQWQALCANDPDTVLQTLAEAFEDNEAPAVAVGVEGTEVSLVVEVPGLDVIPDRMPEKTAVGNVAMPKMTKTARADYYKLMLCGHLLATLRETFAVGPGLASARVAVVRLSPFDAYGKRHPDCLLAARFTRSALSGVRWDLADAARIVNDTATDLHIRQRGQTSELLPLDLSDEPALAALLAACDLKSDD